MAAAVDLARCVAALTRREPENRLPALYSCDPGEDSPPGGTDRLETRTGLARLCEEAAKAVGQGDTRTRASTVGDSFSQRSIAHSGGGPACRWSSQRAWCSLEIVARRNGQRRTGFEIDWAHSMDGLDPTAVGRAAARRAWNKFDASCPRTGKTALLLDPCVTAGLFNALAAALSAKAVLRGRSLLAGWEGRKVASEVFTLVDHGNHPDGFHSAPVDGEGVLSTRTVLIDAGALQGFLHDSYTAAHLGALSTGHAVRDGYAGPPAVGTRNLFPLPSGPTPADLLASISQGIMVDEVMGLHTVDPVSGDFSLGALGRRIQAGKVGAPLDGFTISGNILPFLRSVQAVANDLRFFTEGAGGSTVLLHDIMVSGS
ncbi:MAG: TldD/PmbA family protein [Acidobacteriota bacterium]